MRPHIVVKSIHEDWVISRLARYLVEGLGWDHGRYPDPRAEINIFFPYLEWRHTAWKETPTAAWMTHKREGEWGGKIWRRTAKALALRVTPCELYARDLEPFGPTAHIPHPVDLDHFTIGGEILPRMKRREFQIGVSGTVYRDGRKGEGLVQDLVTEGWWIQASGKGWPCPTQWYDWETMPLFYRSLDCYLCTASIEGGPVTVLEALACGTPVVIPWGVGQCDEYPEQPGIRHYVAGDLPDLESALARTFAECDHVAPQQIRAIAERYPITRWCQDWQRALEKLHV